MGFTRMFLNKEKLDFLIKNSTFDEFNKLISNTDSVISEDTESGDFISQFMDSDLENRLLIFNEKKS